MKKMYLLLGAFTFAASAAISQTPLSKEKQTIERPSSISTSSFALGDRAPGDIVLSDDFSDFGNWTTSTLDGTTANWELVATTPPDLVTFMEEMASPTNDNGFAAFNGVTFLLDGDVDPIDAILEYDAVIDCSLLPNVNAEFFAAYRAFNTDELFFEVTNDGWDTFESYELFPDLITNAATEQELMTIDISEVAGGESDVQVRFRFRELSGDDDFGSGYGAMIDDFVIKEPWEYDLELLRTYHRSGITDFNENGLEYYMIPLDQVEEIGFSGIGRNFGSATQTGSKINVSVTGPETYDGISALIDFESGAIDSFYTTTGFAPTIAGSYDVTYWMDGDVLDEAPENDTLTTQPIMITDEATGFAYARDNGIQTGSIGNVTSNEGLPLLIGNSMRIVSDGAISSVEIFITADPENVGQLMYAQISLFDEDAGSYIYIDQTDDHEVTAADLGTFVQIFFEDNVFLEANSNILLLAGHYGGADEIRFGLAQETETGTVLGYPAGSSDPFFLLDPTTVMVRANMEEIDFTLDTDGDGIIDFLELDTDTDGDGIDNYLDDDDDGDGIPTIDEDGDTDGDGIDDYLDTDDDGDGIPTDEEEDGDSDDDGIDDYLDDDDDGDGIPTIDEVDGDTDEDGIVDYLDTDDDGDGVLTEDEGADDTDGDGDPDYLDTDDDGDGILTEDEEDGDTDGDGLDNFEDMDDDGDGIPTIDEVDGDSDEDGIVDYLDDDDDNDGVPTLDEEDGDTDGDGIDNYLDTDDDGDGILTEDELDEDTDGDGIDNYLDNDDDGDGILTENELDEDDDGEYDDTDGDGVVDYLDEQNLVGINPNENTSFSLGQNYPNPFDQNTTIAYELQHAAKVSITVTDITGKTVILIPEDLKPAGSHTLTLSKNDFSNGIYFYTFSVNNQRITKKMIVK